MSKLKSEKMGISSVKNDVSQELAFLRNQIQHYEKECSALRHQCTLLRDENSAMQQLLGKIQHVVFDTNQ